MLLVSLHSVWAFGLFFFGLGLKVTFCFSGEYSEEGTIVFMTIIRYIFSTSELN